MPSIAASTYHHSQMMPYANFTFFHLGRTPPRWVTEIISDDTNIGDGWPPPAPAHAPTPNYPPSIATSLPLNHSGRVWCHPRAHAPPSQVPPATIAPYQCISRSPARHLNRCISVHRQLTVPAARCCRIDSRCMAAYERTNTSALAARGLNGPHMNAMAAI